MKRLLACLVGSKEKFFNCVFGKPVRRFGYAGMLLLCLFVTNLSRADDVALSWTDNSDNEEGFSVERSDDGAAFEVIGTTSLNTVEYIDNTAQIGVSYEYRVNAFNDFGMSGYTNTVTSILSQANTAPTISTFADVSVDQDQVVDVVVFTIADEQTSAADLVVSASSSNSDLIVEDGILINGSTGSRSLSLQPVSNASGEATITVTVSDGELESTSSFVLTVNAVAQPDLVVTPIISPVGGAFASSQNVVISTSTSNTTIYYTTDGTTPTSLSSVYTTAITVLEDSEIQAFAVDNASDLSDSLVAAVSFDLIEWDISNTWYNISMDEQSENFTMAFDCTPSGNNIDWVVGFSDGLATTWGSLGVAIRFNSTGQIDVRSGAAYMSDVTLEYVGGVKYAFVIDVDLQTHVFSVNVTPQGESLVTLASDADFRIGQADLVALNNIGSYAATSSGGNISNFEASEFFVAPEVSIVDVSSSETDLIHGAEPFTVSLDISNTDLIEKVSYYIDGELYGDVLEAPFSSSMTISSQGVYEVRVVAHLIGRSETVTITQTVTVVAPLTSTGLVEALRSEDLDRVEQLGTTEYERRIDVFSVGDSSGEIAGTIDSNRFAYLLCEGDVELTARLLELQGGSSDSVAGLMIRSALYGQATEVSVLLDNAGEVSVRYRESRRGITVDQAIDTADLDFAYLRIQRVGSAIIVSGSVDGEIWTVFAEKSLDQVGRVFVGMALAAGQSGLEATARFDSVVLNGTLSDYSAQDVTPAVPTELSSSSVANVN